MQLPSGLTETTAQTILFSLRIRLPESAHSQTLLKEILDSLDECDGVVAMIKQNEFFREELVNFFVGVFVTSMKEHTAASLCAPLLQAVEAFARRGVQVRLQEEWARLDRPLFPFKYERNRFLVV